jgi:hypothetical protein
MQLGGALVLAVIASGQTFGQRCVAAGHERGTAAWALCVSRLAGEN